MKSLSVLSLVLGVASVAGAATFNVTHDVDDAYGFRGVDSLTNAIIRANGSDTIRIAPGVYDLSVLQPCHDDNKWGTMSTAGASNNGYNDGFGVSCLWFNKTLTIEGTDTTHWSRKTPAQESVLKGASNARIIYGYTGSGRNSRFRHLVFEDGHTEKDGGAILFQGTEGALTISSNCVFRNCSASTGGATFDVSVCDCLFTNNTAVKGGAAFGTTQNKAVTNTFDHCVFRDNTATGVNGGGALYCDNYDGCVGCIFSNNTATSGSGGALVANKCGPLSFVRGCTFLDNKNQGGDGGGAFCARTRLGNLADCTFIGNQGNAGAGALLLAGVGVVTNCVFSGNTSTGSGGGVYCKTGTDRLVDCRFMNNAASYSAGAYCASDSAISDFSGCTFLTNTAIVAGGAVTFGKAQTSVADCVFEGNSCRDDAGALSFATTVGLMTNCTFIGNHAGRNAASMQCSGYTKIAGCTFRNNVADKSYAGVYCTSFSGAGTVEDCVLDNNTNQVGNVGSQLRYAKNVVGCTFKGYGDMFAVNYDRCTFEGCRFDYDNYGGGMIVFDTVTGAGHLRNCLFENNSVHIYLKNATAAGCVEVANCTFVSNSVDQAYNIGAMNTADGYLFYAFRGGSDPDNPGKALPATNVILNCVFMDNTRNGARNDVNFYVTGTSVATPAVNVFSNCVYETASFVNNPTVQGNLWQKRMAFTAGASQFGDVPYYTPRRGSAAMDAGLSLEWMTAEATDRAGNPRINGNRVDLGCYECWLPNRGTMIIVR